MLYVKPFLGSIKKYITPAKKLKIAISIIDVLVFGSVLMNFDNPATLLILDIIFCPTLFFNAHMNVGNNRYIKFIKMKMNFTNRLKHNLLI